MKKNLDYFKFDTKFNDDRKTKRMLRKFGAEGAFVVITLYQMIYKDKGYYIEFDEDLCFDLSVDFFQSISEKKIKKIIRYSVELNFFDRHQFEENNVLTSKRIIEQYDEGCFRRKNVKVRAKIVKMLSSCLHNVSMIDENDNIIDENDNIIDENDDTLRHIREDKKREEKRKEKTNKKEDVENSISDSVSEKGNDQIEVEKTIDELKAEFDVVRKKFKNKLGLDEAFQQFRNKCRSDKKLRETLPLLLPAVEREIALREQAEREKAEGIEAFYPRMKNFRTWISQSCWNQETEIDYSKAKNKFSSVNNPDSARINDAELSESRAEEYKKYLKWVEKDFPVLIRSECKIFSKKEFDDVKTDNFFKARKERVTDKKLTQMIKDSHSELNLKGYERQKFSCFSHIKAAVKKVFDNVYS